MPADKFRFVSPGIQLREIDRSQIPDDPEIIGPLVIGRARRGPSLRPVKVQNYSEFVEIFGEPSPGGQSGDVWREGGETLSPIYGAYAAQAWLRNGTPLTYIRLQGRAHTDATTDAGEAGWKVGVSPTADVRVGGAYGLFLIDSGTNAGTNQSTGTLAAIWYCETGSNATIGGASILLSGSNTALAGMSGTCALLSNGFSGPTFEAIVNNDVNVKQQAVKFNFDRNSGNFIRKVFNTNPTLMNSSLYSTGTYGYFLGETFEREVEEKISNTAADSVWGVILGLYNGETAYGTQQVDAQPAMTNWVIAQDIGSPSDYVPENSTKLFQIVALDTGEWANGNLKISISDIRYSDEPSDKWGTFSLMLRKADDSDSAPKIIESFTGLNLNPNSPNYIARRIGDSYAQWSDTKRAYREYGRFPNLSRYIRVKMASAIDAGGSSNESLLPFGYFGPLRFKGFGIASGAADATAIATYGTTYATAMAHGANLFPNTQGATADFVYADSGAGTTFSGSFQFPTTPLRANTTLGNLSSPKDAYFGVDTSRSGSSIRFDDAYIDLVRGLPGSTYNNVDTFSTTSPDNSKTVYQYIFSMDDISYHTASMTNAAPSDAAAASQSIEAYYISGSRTNFLALSSTGSKTYRDTLDDGFDQFTIPMFGGFNGTDITETEPFNNNETNSKTQLTSYAYNSIKLAIDACADPERVEYNIMAAPGITTTGLTDHLIDVCQRRADAMGLIDIGGSFVPASDRDSPGNDYDSTNRGNVDGAGGAVQTLKGRQINNSYAACYYPWLTLRDSESGLNFFAPPSIAALGTYAYSESQTELWFAPAGFTRGGLTEGAGGIPVVGVTEKLTSRQRDQLYEVNINPIASFPAEGIVVFGQKTLQSNRSALDRINVRRLMIHVKKEISRISARLLFDPNMQTTWDRFTGQVGPFLESVKQRMGLMDYKVVLDTTTTTPDLIDRNIMYAKIFLKPARAIEFIALDFIITNSGASFED